MREERGKGEGREEVLKSGRVGRSEGCCSEACKLVVVQSVFETCTRILQSDPDRPVPIPHGLQIALYARQTMTMTISSDRQQHTRHPLARGGTKNGLPHKHRTHPSSRKVAKPRMVRA